jgi:hypothetical protein
MKSDASRRMDHLGTPGGVARIPDAGAGRPEARTRGRMMSRRKRAEVTDRREPERGPRRSLAWAAVVAVGVVAVVAAALLSGRGPLGPQLAASAADAVTGGRETAIVVTPPRLDVGDVFMDVSEVPLRFEVTNTGERVAVITYIETSCDCTEAAIVVDGREGPRFRMSHATPPGTFDWRAVLAPSETVALMVYYDPQAHGVFTPAEAPAIHGPISRIVRLHSDDPRDPFVDLRIDLNQRH